MVPLECTKFGEFQYWENSQTDSTRVCGLTYPQNRSALLCSSPCHHVSSTKMFPLKCWNSLHAYSPLLYFAERASCVYNDFANTEDIGSYKW